MTRCLSRCCLAHYLLAAWADKASRRESGFWTVSYTYRDEFIAATASATSDVQSYEHLSDYHDMGSTSGRPPCRKVGAVGNFRGCATSVTTLAGWVPKGVSRGGPQGPCGPTGDFASSSRHRVRYADVVATRVKLTL